MSEDFKLWIGTSVQREDVITRRLADEYQATLAPNLFMPSDTTECPPGFHWCVAVPAHETSRLGPDGAEAKGIFLPPVDLPRRMWAGGKVETFRPLRIGDHIHRVSTISDITQRAGKSGALCFISVTHELRVGHELAIRERQDILYREATWSVEAQPAPNARPKPELTSEIEATPLMLFRFSAVTFNGHRIHYDLPYATGIEGYDGLLVHGPLQAALTLNQMSVLKGALPRTFDYRCVSPLTAGQRFRVQGWRADSQTIKSVIVNAVGVCTIEAEATD